MSVSANQTNRSARNSPGRAEPCNQLQAPGQTETASRLAHIAPRPLDWPIGQTNGPPRLLSVDNIQTDLRLLPDDQWALDHFHAVFHGANLQLSGLVTNASAVRDWKMFATTQAAPRARCKIVETTRRYARSHPFLAPPNLS